MNRPSAPDPAGNDASRSAIARVLQAEREATESIERTRQEAVHMAEAARSEARRLNERTERRIRAVQVAFERELACRLATIEADAAALAQPHVLREDELAALDQAVHALAQELTGTPT